MPLAFAVRYQSFKIPAPDVIVNVVPRHQCLICHKIADSSKKSSGQLGVEERQLSAIYLVNKLLEIPSEVCANYLENFGNPEEWISICPDCSSFVDEGRRLFNQIRQLEQAHKRIGQEIRLKMNVKPNTDEIDEGQVNFGTAAHEIRNYLDTLGDLDGNEELSEVNDCLQVDINLEKDPLENCPDAGIVAPETKTKRKRQPKIKKSAESSKSTSTRRTEADKRLDPFSIGGVKCLECDARFKDNGFLESHMRWAHFDKEGLKCTACLVVYNKINAYKKHHKKKLTTDPSSPCATAGVVCDKGDCSRFYVLRCSPQALDLHAKIFHTANPTTDHIFSCDVCNENFPTKRDLIFHRLAHKRENKFVCPRPGCSKTFQTPTRLKNHLEGIHAKLDGAAHIDQKY